MKKKIIFIYLMMLVIPTINLQAKEQYSQEELLQGGGYENILINDNLDQSKEKLNNNFFNKFKIDSILNLEEYNNYNLHNSLYSANSATYPWISDVRSGFFGGNYPIEQQAAINYCGPAAVKTTLHIINGSSLSQTTYASSMGTDSTGTYVYKIVNELNARQNSNDYGYREIASTDDVNRLFTPIYYDLSNKNVPTIVRIDTRNLWLYNEKSLMHYVTITGYTGYQMANNELQLIYADNYKADYGRGTTFGKHQDSFNNFFNATSYLIW